MQATYTMFRKSVESCLHVQGMDERYMSNQSEKEVNISDIELFMGFFIGES